MNLEAIRQRLPHAGSMVLIDRVLKYDSTRLSALSQTHHRTHHPLAIKGQLPATAALEMAAQAAALHGSLHSLDSHPKQGFIASVRQLHWNRSFFDPASSDIQIEVEWIASEAQGALYAFYVSTAEGLEVQGRFMIHFPAQEPPTSP